MLACARATDAGCGVLFLIANYSGDVLNFEFAAELAEAEGMEVAVLAAGDDIASAPKGEESRRRGIAGIVFLYKVAGAAAAAGASLDEVRAVTERAAGQLRSMGVALAPCTIPAVGHHTFEVADGQMEIGMGIHGEPGVRQGPLESAEQIGVELTEAILADLDAQPGDAFAVLVNGLGATPPEELHALFRTVAATVTGRGMTIERTWIGEFATSLEMAGASVSLLRLSDELRPLLATPVHTPFVSLA
jgi:dihydroxyacetone kinase-like protein